MPATADKQSGAQQPAGRTMAALSAVGPGLAIAATGVGAGDLVAAAAAGSRYGLAVAWAAVAGAALKFALNEGLARWQLSTGTTLLEGWARHLGRWVQAVFLCYLLLWSFVVGGALIAACGIAAHALAPGLSLAVWGIVHSLVAAAVVLIGGYGLFERLIKWFIGVMFATLIGSALWLAPSDVAVDAAAAAAVPPGSIGYLLGVIGGVGGSVTLLSYGYWMRERGWTDARYLATMRVDLAVAYGLTGLFGVAVVVLSAHTLHASGTPVAGTDSALDMARMLEAALGAAGRWAFLIGFWGAVATSMLGVWQGVPYLFCDFVALLQRQDQAQRARTVSPRSAWYRAYLAWIALPPMALLYLDKPVAVVVAYSILGALFMPFLAGTLLHLGTAGRKADSRFANGWTSTIGLALCLALFGALALRRIAPFW